MKFIAVLVVSVLLLTGTALASEVEAPAALPPENDGITEMTVPANDAFSMRFRDAVDAAGEYAAVGGDIDYLSVVAERDGRYYRTVTILDDRAKMCKSNETCAASGAEAVFFNSIV